MLHYIESGACLTAVCNKLTDKLIAIGWTVNDRELSACASKQHLCYITSHRADLSRHLRSPSLAMAAVS